MAAAGRSPPAGALCCDWLIFPAAARQVLSRQQEQTADSEGRDTTRPLLGRDDATRADVHAKNGNLCAPLLSSLCWLRVYRAPRTSCVCPGISTCIESYLRSYLWRCCARAQAVVVAAVRNLAVHPDPDHLRHPGGRSRSPRHCQPSRRRAKSTVPWDYSHHDDGCPGVCAGGARGV